MMRPIFEILMTEERCDWLDELYRTCSDEGKTVEVGVRQRGSATVRYKVKVRSFEGNLHEVNPPPCGQHSLSRVYRNGAEIYPNKGGNFLVPLDAAFLRELKADDLRHRLTSFASNRGFFDVTDRQIEAIALILGYV
jgi:hypothetical protein